MQIFKEVFKVHSKNEDRYQIFMVGNREFKLYYQKGDSGYLILPDFETYPEYSDDGHPFRLMIHDECPKCTTKGEICGGCHWFVQEKSSPIGICMNDAFSICPTFLGDGFLLKPNNENDN